jgi:hypothetical protein
VLLLQAVTVRANKYLVVYCLDSNTPADVKEALMHLKASHRLNQQYKRATYCILRSVILAPA